MASLKKGNKRLLKLANFLAKSKPAQEHFNLDTFISLGQEARKEKLNAKVIFEQIAKEERTCGTTACAIGWCPIALPKLFVYKNCSGLAAVASRKTGEFEWGAARDIFHLSVEETDYLFVDDSYVDGAETTAIEVATRIKKFVKRREEAAGRNYKDLLKKKAK